jgi:outer membrane receptor for ferrienterochelin and colicins
MTTPAPSRRVRITMINTCSHGRTFLPILMMLLTASAGSAQAPLSELSLEDLMRLDAGQVYGASERLQPSTQAPSSVTFITAEEIARYGYRTLADVLRSVRGMYVSNDRNFSLIGMRGFGKPGDYNSRILLLINGHRVNDNVFGQAEIGAEFGLDPAMFERVEIIRGPASSIYGDSAFFAVVNVITRTGASLGGASVVVSAGNLGTRLVRASVGRRFANGVDLAVSATGERSAGVEQLYFPAFDHPETNDGRAVGLDGEGLRQFYGRLIFKGLSVTGAYGARQRDVPTASFNTSFNSQDPREETTDRHGLVDAVYWRTVKGARLTARASYDRFSYDGTYPFAGAEPDGPMAVAHQRALGSRWTASSGLTRTFRSHTMSAGLEAIDNVQQDQSLIYVTPPLTVFDSHRSSTQQAIYVQDEARLTRWLIVNAGLRYDRYEDFTRLTPRTALIVMPSSTQSVKYLFGAAFRAPNAYERNDALFGSRVADLRPETIDTHELVWERYLNDWLRTSASTYWYKADRLITVVSDDSTIPGVSFVNQGQVRAKGLELEAQMRLAGGFRLAGSYALQKAVDEDTQAELPNSPRHMAKLRLGLPGPTPRSLVSLEGQYLSRRGTLAGLRTSAAATIDFSMVQPLGRSLELFGGVRNLLDSDYADPVSSAHRQDTIPQNGLTVRLELRWRLWTK